jgi:hypothetical protein
VDDLLLIYFALSFFRRGFLLGFDHGLFTLDVSFPAFFMFVFVVLFTHKCLYFLYWLRFRVRTMNFCVRRFNLYLLLPVLLALPSGCATDKKDEKIAVLRVHIENTANTPGNGQVISVLRSKPVLVPISPEPVLTEANIIEAKVLDTPGGFAVEIKFDETGTWMLEQYSSANPGKHFAIFGQWGEKLVNTRWLAAPIITHRMATGLLAFTPDANRDEVNQLVLGLNNNAVKNRKNSLK